MNPVFMTILVPVFGALFLPLVPSRQKPASSVALLAATFLLSLLAVFPVLKGRELFFMQYFTDWFSLSFVADGLAVFMAAVSSFVAFLICVYSLDYMQHYAESGEFYFWMVLFVGAMMGLIFSANLILLFCFWEVTSVCSWKLIGFYRKEKDAKAADKAFLVTFFGASLMLAGLIIVYLTYGTFEVGALRNMPVVDLVAFLVLAGILSKSAQLPLQSWLPDAGVAPTPVTALLHAAVLVKIGVYMFARFFCLTLAVSPAFLNSCIALSVITIVVAAASALVENNIKRILAYSTISQLGYILLALSLNTGISLKVALVYILAHSLAKAGLFLCAGIVEHKTGTKDIHELGGLLPYMPYTAAAYLLCAFSIIGIPPLLGFWPKFMVVMLAVKSGHILAGVLAVAGALATLLYLMRLFNKVFLGQVRIKASEDKNSPMVWVVLVLAAASLALGLGFKVPFHFVMALIK
ncbi:MAG TPA: NADH-quinone oxidoreductase subunit L [Patescibacteria group bacterium]|nr:NADH-quinone oxidoreductase subunit L [Patescibacteria group bacterium]